MLTPVKVCVVPKPAIVVLAAGNVIVVASVPARVRLLLAVSVFPSATVNVALVAGAVIVSLLMLVAVATPKLGVVKDGLVAKTLLPVPVFVTDTTFLLASSAKAVDAVSPESVVVPLTVRLVKEPPPPRLDTLIKSEPFHAQTAYSPAAMEMPVVGPAPRNVTAKPPEVPLMTTYTLLAAGAVMFRAAVRAPVQFRIAYCDEVLVSEAPVVLVSVTSASVESVCVPATDASR